MIAFVPILVLPPQQRATPKLSPRIELEPGDVVRVGDRHYRLRRFSIENNSWIGVERESEREIEISVPTLDECGFVERRL